MWTIVQDKIPIGFFQKKFHAETALIKLGYVLGKTKNQEKIKELMLQNLAGEFNDKLGNEFLE